MQVHRKPSWELAFTDLTRWGLTVAHQHLKKWLKLTAQLQSPSRISQMKLWKKKLAATQGSVKTDTEIIQAWTKHFGFLEFSSCFASSSSHTWSCSVTTIQWSWILCASPSPFFCFIPLTECHVRVRLLSVKPTFCLYLNQHIWLFGDPISLLLLLQLARDTVCNSCNFSARTCKLCSTVNSCGLSSLLRIIYSYTLFLSYMILFPHVSVSTLHSSIYRNSVLRGSTGVCCCLLQQKECDHMKCIYLLRSGVRIIRVCSAEVKINRVQDAFKSLRLHTSSSQLSWETRPFLSSCQQESSQIKAQCMDEGHGALTEVTHAFWSWL